MLDFDEEEADDDEIEAYEIKERTMSVVVFLRYIHAVVIAIQCTIYILENLNARKITKKASILAKKTNRMIKSTNLSLPLTKEKEEDNKPKQAFTNPALSSLRNSIKLDDL